MSRIRMIWKPLENELPNHVYSYFDIFGYSIEEINKFMDVADDAMVDFPFIHNGHKAIKAPAGMRHSFRRGGIEKWEQISE